MKKRINQFHVKLIPAKIKNFKQIFERKEVEEYIFSLGILCHFQKKKILHKEIIKGERETIFSYKLIS
jgi:hypothetical protein